MAVIVKYVIVRNGKELDQVFSDKKEAEAHDSKLEAAEKLSVLIKQGDLKIDATAETIDAIAFLLAENAPEVLKILKPVKVAKPVQKRAGRKAQADSEPAANKESQSAQPKTKSKAA